MCSDFSKYYKTTCTHKMYAHRHKNMEKSKCNYFERFLTFNDLILKHSY